MSEKIKTCGGCKHRIDKEDRLVGFIHGCGLTGPVKAIPQQTSTKDRWTCFKRIPEWCPRPTSEVSKTEGSRKRWRDWQAFHWDSGEVESMRSKVETA